MAAAHELHVEQAATPPNATPRGSENPAYSPEPELDSAAVRAQATQRKTAAEAKCSTNPQKQRHSCTDVLCALLLLAALALELGVVGLAFALGEPALLLYPRDSSDKLCGYDADVADKPNLAFFDLMQCAQAGGAAFLANCPTTPKVCVASCPSAYWSFISGTAAEAISLGYSVEQRSQMLCKYGVNAYVNMSIYELVNSGQCASYTLESEPLYGRCVPRALSLIKSEIDKAIANRTSSNESISAVVINEAITRLSDAVRQLQPLVSDLVASKWVFACGLVLALALALLWLLLLRFFAAVIVWTLLVAFVLIFAASSAYSFYRYALLRDASQNVSITSTTLSDSFSFSAALSTLDYYMSQSSTWLVLAIVAGVCALVALLIVLFLRKRVVLATRLIEEASRAIGAVWTALLWPLVPFVLVVVAVLFFLTAGVFIASIRNGQKYTNSSANASLLQQCSVSGVASVSGAAEASSCVLQTTFGTWWTTVLLVYNAFMGFWVVNFVHGLGQMTLAGAFSAYYWAPGNPKEMPAFPLGSALFNSLFYHGGSIAFGALLIAIVQVIRLVLSYVKRRLAKKKNPVAKFILSCCQCFMWCLENVLKYISKNAYILVISSNVNFCTAAVRAFKLLFNNCVRVTVLNKVTDFLLLVGELLVTGATVLLCYYFFVGSLGWLLPLAWVPPLTYFSVPLVLLGVGSFAIAVYCFSVFHMAVDTLFLCAMEDLETNDGSENKQYHMTTGLLSALRVKNIEPQPHANANGASTV